MAARPEEHPQVIDGRYEVVAHLGTGGMAAVYHALDTHTGKRVAIKLMHRRASREDSMVKRFAREMRAAVAVRHPNVVRGLDCGSHADQPFIVLELVRGRTLASHLIEGGAMSVDVTLLLALHAARGLEALHAHGVVHRDVKPQNMLVLAEPGDEAHGLKVVDLGLVRRASDVASITRAGVRLGTTNFMAPEQVLAERVDGRTDVYGLGMVIFSMLTAHLPFIDKRPTVVLAHQVLSAVPPPSWFAPDIDETLDKVVQTALRKNPKLRYPCMTDLRLDLERLVGTRDGDISALNFKMSEDIYPVRTATGRTVLASLRRDLHK